MIAEKFDAIDAKLQSVEDRYAQVEEQMADPAIATDPRRLMELGRERSDLTGVVEAYRDYKQTRQEIEATSGLLTDDVDPELAEMAHAELEVLEERLQKQVDELKRLL